MRICVFWFMLVLASPAFADDWMVSRVRGDVTQQVGAVWQTVQRGDVIADNRYLRTGADGRIGLARGAETIELQANTQIRIEDAGPERMTSVLQDFGVVTIEAERRNVQHFSVQTPFLAAVVKGTRFTVLSDQSAASVQVNRGIVQVQDTLNDLVVDVRPGQEATVSTEAPLLVEGAGAIVVYSFEGVPVVNGTTQEVEGATSSPGKSASSNAGGNGRGNAYGLGKRAVDPDTIVTTTRASASPGNSANSRAGGNGNGNAVGLTRDATETGNDAATAVTGSPGNSSNSNAGGNGRGNAYGLNGD